MASSDANDADGVVNTSPSRGKLRPGKELLILSDEINQETALADSGPLMSGESAANEAKIGSSQRTMAGQANNSASSKKFANLSMMERQAEWLRKKEEKLAAEKLRQDEEKQKELTFQPKLIRRSTFNSDKPLHEERQPPSARSAAVVRSDSFGATAKPTSENTSSAVVTVPQGETRRPPSGNINAKRGGSAKPGKKKKFIPVDQRLEVQSNLLDSMKSELEASMQMAPAQLLNTATASESDSQPEEASPSADPPGSDVSLSSEAAGEQAPPVELKSWQACSVIGGFRVDFDSSDTKARLVLQDASRFELSSMYRKTDRKAQRDGVALHMGRREDTYEEEVIAVLFDKEKVSESDAAKWWKDHEHRFAQYIRDRSPAAAHHALAAAVAALSH